MTKKECQSLPLRSMFDDVIGQLSLTRQELELFQKFYMEGLRIRQCADEMCIDVQLATRIHRKIKWKLSFVDLKAKGPIGTDNNIPSLR